MSAGLAVCGFGVALVACGDDGDAAGDTTTTSTSDTTIASTTTTQDPEAEVKAAYLAYWKMQRRLAESPDPDDREITQRASGPARNKLIDSLTTMRATGQTLQFGPRYSHSVRSVDVQNDEATVRDCAVDDGARVNTKTGEEDDLGLSTSLLETNMIYRRGTWLVNSLSELRSWDGVTLCES